MNRFGCTKHQLHQDDFQFRLTKPLRIHRSSAVTLGSSAVTLGSSVVTLGSTAVTLANVVSHGPAAIRKQAQSTKLHKPTFVT